MILIMIPLLLLLSVSSNGQEQVMNGVEIEMTPIKLKSMWGVSKKPFMNYDHRRQCPGATNCEMVTGLSPPKS